MLGSFATNLHFLANPWVALGISVGATLEAYLAARLLNRTGDHNSSQYFTKVSLVIQYLFIAGALAPSVSASIGVFSCWVGSVVATPEVAGAWSAWWLGDFISTVTVAPFLLLMNRWIQTPQEDNWNRKSFVVLAVLIGTAFLVFWEGNRGEIDYYVGSYSIFPITLWLIFRVGPSGGANAVVVVSIIAILGTLTGHGDFLEDSLVHSLLSLQTFVGTLAVASLIFGAVVCERNQITKQLSESEEKFRTLGETIPQIIFSTDGRGNVELINKRWYEYTGKAREDLKSLDWSDVLHPEDLPTSQASWQNATMQRKPFTMQHRLRRKDGAFCWHMTQALPLTDSTGKVIKWFGASTNIDEQKRTEEKLEQAIRARDDVLGIISHDLRSPISVATLNLALISKLPIAGALRTRVFLQVNRIQRALDRMSSLIDDLLDITRMDAGALTLERRKELANTLISDAVDLYLPLAEENYIDLELDEDFLGKDEAIFCDYKRILQVLSNLIGNAIKFTQERGRVIVGVKCQAQDFLFSVQDNGRGISRDDLPHIFARFWQGKSSVRKGAGLGLSIAKRIVEAHGGNIWVDSQEGQGTTFYFTIPKHYRENNIVVPINLRYS